MIDLNFYRNFFFKFKPSKMDLNWGFDFFSFKKILILWQLMLVFQCKNTNPKLLRLYPYCACFYLFKYLLSSFLTTRDSRNSEERYNNRIFSEKQKNLFAFRQQQSSILAVRFNLYLYFSLFSKSCGGLTWKLFYFLFIYRFDFFSFF